MTGEICVKQEALSIDDGEGGAVAPQVGDTVQAMIEGTVTRVVDGVAYIAPQTANGEPVVTAPPSAGGQVPGAEGEEMDLAAEGDALRQELEAMGAGMGMGPR